MIIHRMQATFGTLAGDELKPGEGLNIIYAPNESGKSTWCAFLRAMLYGIDTAQRARGGRLPDKTKYAPWSGAPMAGLMELTHNGEAITLRRTTAQRGAPMGEFSAVYTGTSIPVPGLTAANAGEQLTGVSADVFARTAFIGQGGVMLSGTPELEKRIASIVTAGEEDCSYTEADAQLRAWLRKRRHGTRGALPDLERQIAETEQRLQRLNDAEQQRQLLRQELEQTDAEIEDLARSMNAARSRERRDALRTISAEKAHLQALEQRFDAARRDAAQKRTALEQTAFGVADPNEVAQRVDRDAKRIAVLEQTVAKRQTPYLGLTSLVLAALAVVLALLLKARPLYFAAVAFVVIGLALLARYLRSAQRADKAERRLAALLAEYGAKDLEEIFLMEDAHRAAFRACRSAMHAERTAAEAVEEAREEQAETHERLLQELDFEHGEGEAADVFRRKQALEQVRSSLRARLEREQGAASVIGDPMALESELRSLLDRHAALTAQYDAIAHAVTALGAADREIQKRFSPALARKAAEYMQTLTDGRYDALALTRDFTAEARRAGDTLGHSTAYLSAGAADLMYLAVRLAMCELALEREEPCPIILDDTLVNFDDDRAHRAVELLHTLAKKRQIILFTCHKRDYPDALVDMKII
ncbi:MAG: AAA family ATPase [Oscillospiraceae bacterium]|nr:AAA family ATPase [Oscillospiraceae bacterium]